jgi:hypothetical protein
LWDTPPAREEIVLITAGWLGGTDALASTIVINEFVRGSTWSATGDEWVELVLLEDVPAAELDGFFVGDGTPSTESKLSGYQLTDMADFADVFPAGTVLVVGGGAGPAVDLDYEPGAGDWNLVLPATDVHLVSNGYTWDLTYVDVLYVDTNGAINDATLSPAGFAVNLDATPATFGALASVTLGSTPIGTGAANLSAVESAAIDTSWVLALAAAAATPGEPNGGDNTLTIESLRAEYTECFDPDADGLCAEADYCPSDFDPGNVDSDYDGVGDACDPCVDVDFDAVCADVDLCADAFDPDNVDLDVDGIGDVCDDCVDVDGDGLCEADDLCPDDHDPDNLDSDLDGIGDVCDAPITLLDALPGTAGAVNAFTVVDGPANAKVEFLAGAAVGTTNLGCPGLSAGIKSAKILGTKTTDATGSATFDRFLAAGLAGRTIQVQAYFPDFCLLSNVDATTL